MTIDLGFLAPFQNFKKLTRGVVPILLSLVVGLSGCQSLPERSTLNLHTDEMIVPRHQISSTTLAKQAQTLARKNPNQSGFFALADGIDALSARLHLIESSEKALDVQYYIWEDDEVGKAMQYYLLQAATRGVKVRLLLDDMDTAGKDDILLALDRHPNLEVRTFNPFPNRDARWKDFLSSARRVNHRMHNKSITADRSISILGGRNIGNEYFNASKSVNFADMDVIGVGKIAEAVANSFDLYWNSDSTYPISSLAQPKSDGLESLESASKKYKAFLDANMKGPYGQALISTEFNKNNSFDQVPFRWSEWQLIYDLPTKVNSKEVDPDTHLAPQLAALAKDVNESLIIISPYFVPGEKFTQHLVDLVRSGIRVRILTNSLASNDVSLVHAGYQRYRKELVKGGVELFELKPTSIDNKVSPSTGKKKSWLGKSKSSLHGKYFGFDRVAVFVGSFNLDGRSIELNTELGVYFKDEEYAQLLDTYFNKQAPLKAYKIELSEKGKIEWHSIENGQPVIHTKEPNTSFWTRFSTRFLSLIVPEKQL